jgi:hypothetical protein
LGYVNVLAALADPKHAQHRELVRWMGNVAFDRTAFDLIETNAMLQKVPQRTRRISEKW